MRPSRCPKLSTLLVLSCHILWFTTICLSVIPAISYRNWQVDAVAPARFNGLSTEALAAASTAPAKAKNRAQQPSVQALSSSSSSFVWKASLDRDTGIASSAEQSEPFTLMGTSSGHLSSSKNESTKGANKHDAAALALSTQETRSVRQTSRNFVSKWADFVCQGSVTFGLFKVVTTTAIINRSGQFPLRHAMSKLSSLQPRFLPLSLLEFGDVEASRRRDGNRVMEWEIPIRGGFLALPPPTSQAQQPSQRMSRLLQPKWTKDTNDSLGKLTFAIIKLGPSSSSLCSGGSNAIGAVHTYQLTTNIVGYRPWLAGSRRPVPWLRQQLYISTQPYVHAYIVWRFHNRWKRELMEHLS